jgi:hypothetical protein
MAPKRKATKTVREQRAEEKARNRALARADWEGELSRRAAARARRTGSTIDIARELVAVEPGPIAARALSVLARLESERELIKKQAARIAVLETALAQVDPNTLTPEQRVALSLADPVHGPLLRAAAAANNEGEDK